jgi:hypothetical protein
MKSIYGTIIIILFLLFISGCTGRGNQKTDSQTAIDTTSVPDTGYTGIKQYMSGKYIVKEVTFKNGVRDGLMKSFYQDGRVRQTFWYKNGLREDSAKWYYLEGQVFRATPYKNDTVDGTQKQYYRNGRIKARLTYVKGLRIPLLEEFTPEGKLVGGYPEMNVTIKDDYKTRGIYRITLARSDKSKLAKFYKGEFSNGVFDSAHCKIITSINGIGQLNLRKEGSPQSDYVGIIGDFTTNFGNSFLVFKKIELPYNDLK